MKLTLAYPVTPYKLNQAFGVNYYTYFNAFGIQGHNGLDLDAYHGQPVYASHEGTVSLQVEANEGRGIVITSNEKYDYKGSQCHFKSIYWHLCDPNKEPQYKSPLKEGQIVKAGDLIGYADNTGMSTGDHLHFGLKPVKKMNDFYSYNIEQENGYLGAIDPTPYLLNTNPLPKKEDYPTAFAWHRALFWYYVKKFK
jgi:murein DD-endopeptidase MepM/ murein hydrolase activator NlpD